MKNSVILHTLLQTAMLFLACATAFDVLAEPDANKDKDAKARQAMHHLQLQLTAAQQEKTELASQVEALKKQLSEMESKKTELETKLSGQAKQISKLSDKQQQAELSNKQRQAELSDKYQETENKLKQMEQQYATTNNSLQQTKTEKEQEKKRLDGDVQACEKKNAELYQLSVKLMDKYQNKGVWEAMSQKEPFTQLEKVRIENLLQEYRDKVESNRIASGGNEVQHP